MNAVNRERRQLMHDLDNAARKGFFGYVIPWYYKLRREWKTDAALGKAARELVKEKNPDLRRGRIMRFLTGENYLPSIALAEVQKTKQELAKILLGELEGQGKEAAARKHFYRGLSASLSHRPVTVRLSRGRRAKLADSLRKSQDKAEKTMREQQLSVPPIFHQLREQELQLREKLDALGVVPHGQEMDALIDDNRMGGRKLINLVKKHPGLDSWAQEDLVSRAHKLRGGGWFGTRFGMSEKTFYNLADTRASAMRYASFEGRLQYLKTMPDQDTRSGQIKLWVMPPGKQRKRMCIVGRKGKFLHVKEWNAAPTERTQFGVIDVETGKLTEREPSTGGFTMPMQLGDSSLNIL